MLKVKTLSHSDIAQLRRLWESNDMGIPKSRIEIILLSWEEHNVAAISGAVDLHPINVRKWIHRYNDRGISGLVTGVSPGRPAQFTEAKRKEIKRIYKAHPRSVGVMANQWSYRLLQKYVIDGGLVESISLETLRGIVKGP